MLLIKMSMKVITCVKLKVPHTLQLDNLQYSLMPLIENLKFRAQNKTLQDSIFKIFKVVIAQEILQGPKTGL